MAWRSLLISKPARLAVRHRQLQLTQDTETAIHIPLEDIAIVILDTPQATLTSALLSELAAHHAAVITCDATHHPNGLFLPYLPHSRALKVMQAQLALTNPQKKRAWQHLVQHKLRNQAHCLASFVPGAGQFLYDQAERVRSGDPDNREGSAARYYFSLLFDPGFTRDQPRWTNAALNYGYSILRAAIARSLVCHGFLPAFGLHHKNQLNAFNLADDLIEPLRPLVDHWVRQQPASLNAGEHGLSPAHKAGLIGLLYAEVNLRTGTLNTLAAIDQMVHGLARYAEQGDLSHLDSPTPCIP